MKLFEKKSKRDSIEILMEILEFTRVECGIIKLSYGIELNPGTTHEYISALEKRGFLIVDATKKRKKYQTTEKGLVLLNKWDDFVQLIG